VRAAVLALVISATVETKDTQGSSGDWIVDLVAFRRAAL